MYECVICLTINHARRLQCQCCGTIPAEYSIIKIPARLRFPEYGEWSTMLPVIAAYGCDRIERHHAQRVNLRTVPLDYYGE
jgi:hypothetical protein